MCPFARHSHLQPRLCILAILHVSSSGSYGSLSFTVWRGCHVWFDHVLSQFDPDFGLTCNRQGTDVCVWQTSTFALFTSDSKACLLHISSKCVPLQDIHFCSLGYVYWTILVDDKIVYPALLHTTLRLNNLGRWLKLCHASESSQIHGRHELLLSPKTNNHGGTLNPSLLHV